MADRTHAARDLAVEFPKLLAPRDAEHLSSLGLVRPGIVDETVALHFRRLFHGSDHKYRHMEINLREWQDYPIEAFEEIPVRLISTESLMYIGLKALKSYAVWDAWFASLMGRTPQDRTEPAIFMTFFLNAMLSFSKNTQSEHEEDWLVCLRDCGLDQAATDYIMYRRLTSDESCHALVIRYVCERFEMLHKVMQESLHRDIELEFNEINPFRAIGEQLPPPLDPNEGMEGMNYQVMRLRG